MTITPFAPSILDLAGTAPEVWNAICSQGGRPLTIGGTRAQATFRWSRVPAGDTRVMRVKFHRSFELLVSFVRFPFEPAFGTRFDVQDLESLPDQLRIALEDGMVATMLSEIPQESGIACVVTGRGRLDEICPGAEEAQLRWCSVRITGLLPDIIDAVIGFQIADANRFLFSEAPVARQVWPSLASYLKIEANFTLGRVHVSLRSLRSFVAGDLVVLRQGPVRCTVRAARTIFVFDGDGQEWICHSRSVEGGRNMVDRVEAIHDTGQDSDDGPDGINLNDLPIALDFDIGRVLLPISEVQAWQTGSVVLLDPPPLSRGMPVIVRSNGQAIASGELVMIDDRPAVRLQRFDLE